MKTHYGAGSENRTRATRSEAWHSTTKLYPQFKDNVIIIYLVKLYNNKLLLNFIECVKIACMVNFYQILFLDDLHF